MRRDFILGAEIRDRLLGPVADLIARANRIYVIPDQDLALLPLAALPAFDAATTPDAPLRFLGADKEFALLPMAGKPPAWTDPRGPILLAGDPLPDREQEFPALPLAEKELSGLEALWEGDTTRLERRQLTAERLLALPLDEFGTIHLATHAVASSIDPNRCAVILSRGEKLGMNRIAELSLGPALVVLSACRTGEGEVIPGEGVVGLSWAFLRAGARGVAASLWSVEDESTSQLMVAFHRRMKDGEDPVAALAGAQRELAAVRTHPAYWAPFVIIVNPTAGS